MNLLLPPQTKSHVEAFLAKPPHAVILAGPRGAGKSALSSQLSVKVLKIGAEKLQNYPYFLRIMPERNSIGIESIRQLQSFLRLKTTGKEFIRRIVIIEDAQDMTTEAQNAFLKIMEEPPADTVVILTVTDEKTLLPTVVSRGQIIRVRAPSLEDIAKLFGSSAKLEKAYYMSGGRMGLLSALLDDNQDHPLIQDISYAKNLLRLSPYERVIEVDSLSKDKNKIEGLLAALERISHAALLQAAKTNNVGDIKRWQRALKQILESQRALELNAQPKLIVTSMLLNLI